MDRYRRLEIIRQYPPVKDNEMRISSQGLLSNYITHATGLLQEKDGNEIVLKAMGQAISKAVTIAEIIKRKVPRLHQDTTICSTSIPEVWEPIEEGLLPVEKTRKVSDISITLSAKELNKSSPGYQAPASDQQIRPQNRYQSRQFAPRQARGFYNSGGYEGSSGRGWGRGQSRGTNWSQGGYVIDVNYQDYGGYSHYGRGGGRTGWVYGYPGARYGGGRGGGGSRGHGRGLQLVGEPEPGSRGVAF